MATITFPETTTPEVADADKEQILSVAAARVGWTEKDSRTREEAIADYWLRATLGWAQSAAVNAAWLSESEKAKAAREAARQAWEDKAQAITAAVSESRKGGKGTKATPAAAQAAVSAVTAKK